MNSFYQTAVTFTSQNYGAKKLDRIRKIFFICVSCVTVTGFALGLLCYIFGPELLSIYADGTDKEIVIS